MNHIFEKILETNIMIDYISYFEYFVIESYLFFMLCAPDGLPIQTVILGYNDVLLIPAGATSIDISEESSSNNYLGNDYFVLLEHSCYTHIHYFILLRCM